MRYARGDVHADIVQVIAAADGKNRGQPEHARYASMCAGWPSPRSSRKYELSEPALLRTRSTGSEPAHDDLEPLVPKTLENFYDDGHLKEAGARLVGRLLGAFMIREQLVDRSDAGPSRKAIAVR